MVKTVRKLREFGYSRIGFATNATQDRRNQHHYIGAYLAEQNLTGLEPIVYNSQSEKPSLQRLETWLKQSKPDAIIAGEGILKNLTKIGIIAPNDLGVASPALTESNAQLAGVEQDLERLGAVATNTLIEQLRRGSFGLPAAPERVLIEGKWNNGSSVQTSKS